MGFNCEFTDEFQFWSRLQWKEKGILIKSKMCSTRVIFLGQYSKMCSPRIGS